MPEDMGSKLRDDNMSQVVPRETCSSLKASTVDSPISVIAEELCHTLEQSKAIVYLLFYICYLHVRIYHQCLL